MAEARTPRNHYTDFVTHVIRFFITCPDGFMVKSDPDMSREEARKQKVNYSNWQAVQDVWCGLEPEEQRLLTDVYRRKTMPFPEAVKVCAKVHGVSESDAWKLITRVNSMIARARGLI